MKLEYVENYKKTWIDKDGQPQPSTNFRIVLGSGRYVVIKNVFKDDYKHLLDIADRVVISQVEVLNDLGKKKK